MNAIYFQLGFHHLTEGGAWDHQLFLATLALAYAPALWRRWLVLATLFAVGHTLAIGGMAAGWLPQGLPWVETGIVASIGVLALAEFLALRQNPFSVHDGKWRVLTGALVLAFGIVHGLGFGSAFLNVLSPGASGLELAVALLAFTLGVEAAQVLILGGFWVLAWLVFDLVQFRPLLLRKLLLICVAAVAIGTLVAR